jgi:hypothetical protein
VFNDEDTILLWNTLDDLFGNELWAQGSNTSTHLIAFLDKEFKENLPVGLFGPDCEFTLNTRPKFLAIWQQNKYKDLKLKRRSELLYLNLPMFSNTGKFKELFSYCLRERD